MDAQRGARASPKVPKPSAVVVEEPCERLGGVEGGASDVAHAQTEELQPALPIAVRADALQRRIVVASAPLEVEAEIQEGFRQNAFRAKDERDKETTEAAVSVEERVSNCACASAALTKAGVRTSASWRKRSSEPK
ncbi:MAG TPA: hypothetical protein VEI02_07245 [Planctomycetota bacterium]|nr:hypothetical protein [Planctomycetota bacterium]